MMLQVPMISLGLQLVPMLSLELALVPVLGLGLVVEQKQVVEQQRRPLLWLPPLARSGLDTWQDRPSVSLVMPALQVCLHQRPRWQWLPWGQPEAQPRGWMQQWRC
jgi:hypothetical protein